MSSTLHTAYISAKLEKDNKIHTLRDKIYKSLPSNNKYTRRNAHITIIPSFHLPKENFHEINKCISNIEIEEREVYIKGCGVYPNIKNPRVVLLDVDVEFQKERDYLLTKLNKLGAKNIVEPAPPHVTLFKCDNGYDISNKTKTKLQHIISENRKEWETKIKYVDLIPIEHD